MSLKDFVVMGKLGQGTFATVYKARRLSDQNLYAIKKVPPPLPRFKSTLLTWSPKITPSMKLDFSHPSTATTSSPTMKPSTTKKPMCFTLSWSMRMEATSSNSSRNRRRKSDTCLKFKFGKFYLVWSMVFNICTRGTFFIEMLSPRTSSSQMKPTKLVI